MPQRGAMSYSVRGVNPRPLSHRKEMSARNGSRGASFPSAWTIPTILHCERRPRVRSILILYTFCVCLPSIYTMWLDHNQVCLVVTTNTPKHAPLKPNNLGGGLTEKALFYSGERALTLCGYTTKCRMLWNHLNNPENTWLLGSAIDTAVAKPCYLAGLFLPMTFNNLLPAHTQKVTSSPELLGGNEALVMPWLQPLEGGV